jgi:hypothetical protein
MSTGQTSRLVPAVVIVDSRNVWGSFETVFGQGREVRVPGVINALKGYGFDALEVHVAIGTIDGGKGTPSKRLGDSLERNQRYAASVDSDPLGRVLHGRLVERDGEMSEKLVDVQCAIQIARSAVAIQTGAIAAEAIVVLSEDMDLIPAYRFAQDLDVPVYAASHATVDTRPDCHWLLLTEGPLAAISRPPGRAYGSDLRRPILAMTDTIPNAHLRFKIRAFDSRHRRLFLQHNSGALAYTDDTAGLRTKRNEEVFLHVLGIGDAPGGGDFPYLLAGQTPPAGPPADIVFGTVVRWTTATRVEVQLGSGAAHSVACSPGTLLPGMPVQLLDRPHGQQQRARRLIGSSATRPPTPGWSDPAWPELVTVTSSAGSPGALVRAVTASGQEITLQPPGTFQARAGDRYAAVPADHVTLSHGDVHVQAVAVSAPLPT